MLTATNQVVLLVNGVTHFTGEHKEGDLLMIAITPSGEVMISKGIPVEALKRKQ